MKINMNKRNVNCKTVGRDITIGSKIPHANPNILEGIDETDLVFAKMKPNGVYDEVNSSNIRTNQDWSVGVLIRGDDNFSFNFNAVDCSSCIINSGWTKSHFQITVWYTNDGGATKQTYKQSITHSSDVVEDRHYITFIATYESVAKRYRIYINNILVHTYTIPEGYEPYPVTGDISIVPYQGTGLYYYLYNRLLNDEQRTHLHDTLIGYVKTLILDKHVTLNENESYDLNVTLDGKLVKNNKITVSTNNYNVEVYPKTFKFNKYNHNIPQTLRLYGNFDSMSSSDKSTKLTFKPENGIHSEVVNVDIINTTPVNTTLEAGIKAQYPDKCINFRGSFNFYNLTSNYFDTCSVGDFWVNDKVTAPHIYHGRLHYPNDILYYDGVNVQPLYRNKYTDLTVEDEYDVCIVGGGAGGVATAYSLKDKGYKVCLVEKLHELGGTHIHASIPVLISTPINGTWFKDIVKEAYETGMTEINTWSGRKEGVGEGELFDRLWRSSLFCNYTNQRGIQWNVSMWWFSNRYYQDLHNTIDIKFRTEFVESVLDGSKVTKIKVKSLDTDTEYYISAKYFVDCSADGVLCRSNKVMDVDYYIGTDGRARFNEQSYASDAEPDKYGINTIEAGYLVQTGTDVNTANKNNETPLWDELPDPADYPDITNRVNGMTYDPQFRFIRSISPTTGCAVDPHIFIDQGNDAALESGFLRSVVHWQLYTKGTPYLMQNKMLGIRESYRINCDRMLTQTDCEKLITADDIEPEHIIALSTWYADLHNAAVSVKNSGFNGIPYESLIPCAFNNVLVASRCFGCSHIAQSSFRLSKTMMSLGYVAGNALSQCIDNHIENVRNIDIAKLQSDVDIMGLYNEIVPYIQV